MAWLTREDQVLAAVELTSRVRPSAASESVVVTAQAGLVQLLALPAGVDVAWCQSPAGETVQRGTQVLVVRGIGRRAAVGAAVAYRPRMVLVAPSASFDRWHLRVGDRLEVHAP